MPCQKRTKSYAGRTEKGNSLAKKCNTEKKHTRNGPELPSSGESALSRATYVVQNSSYRYTFNQPESGFAVDPSNDECPPAVSSGNQQIGFTSLLQNNTWPLKNEERCESEFTETSKMMTRTEKEPVDYESFLENSISQDSTKGYSEGKLLPDDQIKKELSSIEDMEASSIQEIASYFVVLDMAVSGKKASKCSVNVDESVDNCIPDLIGPKLAEAIRVEYDHINNSEACYESSDYINIERAFKELLDCKPSSKSPLLYPDKDPLLSSCNIQYYTCRDITGNNLRYSSCRCSRLKSMIEGCQL